MGEISLAMLLSPYWIYPGSPGSKPPGLAPDSVVHSFWNEDDWQGKEEIPNISAPTLYQVNHQHHMDQPVTNSR